MQMQTDIQYQRRKRAALWVAGFFSVLAATFLTIGLLNSIVLKAGVFDWSDILLQVLGGLWLVAAVVSFELIRRERVELAGGILFSTNFMLTLGIFLALANVAALVLIYYVTTSLLLISLIFSPESRVRWLILMSVGVVIAVMVEVVDPAFRTQSVVLIEIAPYVILSAILVFTGIIVWQVRARSLSVGLRIGVGFVFVLLLLIIVGLIVIQSLNELDAATQAVFTESDRAQIAYQIDAGLWSLVAVEKDILLQSADASAMAALADEYTGQRAALEELFNRWAALGTDEVHQDMGEIQALVADLDAVVDLALENQLPEATRLNSEQINPQLAALSTRIAANLEEEQAHRAAAIGNLSEVQYDNTFYIMVVITIALLVGIVLSFFISQSILQPVNDFVQVTRAFGAGDRSVRAQEAPDEIGDLARAFNQTVEQLDHLYTSLEQQVAERTRALETSTEVSRRLSTILDPNQLVREVVEQLQSAFGFYHAHIYLYDDDRQNLVMAGGTGDAGRTMLGRGHKIGKGRGLVGQAAETNQLVLIPDVSQAEGWLPNPLLPETKAEVAVPIAIGEEVLGVLDVQHNIVEGITQQETELIQAIANQVAIAVRNAQAYSRTQHQAEREARVVAINQHIQAATRIEDVLQIAIRELGQALGAERSSIELQLPGEER